MSDRPLPVVCFAVLRYSVAVFTTKLVSASDSDEFDVFITIFGKHGDTGRRHLQQSMTHPRPFAANQTDVFFIEAVHLGRPQHILLEFTSHGRGWIYSYPLCNGKC